jgi:hypothetical protein
VVLDQEIMRVKGALGTGINIENERECERGGRERERGRGEM